jgi:RNA polymerase sigma factor (sigma-70 family)
MGLTERSMLTRSFLSLSASGGEASERQAVPAREADFIVLPAATSDSWRTWLMTGVRRPPFDRSRIRGAHKGLKKLLIEGTPGTGDRPQPWNDFSSAMVRQAVDEALNSLPLQHKQVVKLAYFGGMSNREIATKLEISPNAVRRRLQEALATVSAFVERGRVLGRRVVLAIAGWFAGRTIVDAAHRSPGVAVDQVLQAAVVAVVGVAAAAVLSANPATTSPAQHNQSGGGNVRMAAPAGAGHQVAPAANLPLKQAIPVDPAIVPPIPGLLPIPLPAADPGEPIVPALPAVPVPKVRLPVPVNDPPVTVPDVPKLWR